MAKISTLTDDFQDGVIDASKWLTIGTVAETGGRARLTPTTSTTFWGAATSYDLTSSSITAHVPVVTPVGTSGSLQSGMAVQKDVNNIVSLYVLNNELICEKKVAGVIATLAFTPYSNVNHLYWRIRESAGTVFWETSATGTGVFFIQNTATVASLFAMTTVTPYFATGYSGFEASPGTLQIEAVNPGLQITAAGSSTSAGGAQILKINALTGAASSTSAGSAAITIPPPSFHTMTASGSSTTTGSASFIILAPSQMSAAGQSYSSGSAALRLSGTFSATGQSFSTGTATLTVLTPAPDASITQYFYFEPPIAYDLPPTLPHPRPRYLNAHARWKGGQRRGRSVLKLNGVYVTKDTPTVDETLAATEVYMGGHIYTINNITADALVAAGYAVTPIPVNLTLYPAEDVYPEANLFPGYQEFIPDQVAV